MKKSVIAIAKDVATGVGIVLNRIIEGDVLDNTKSAIASFSFKDHNGNAVFPSLDPSGAFPVTLVSGKPFVSHGTFLVSNQVKDSYIKAVSVSLEVDNDEAVIYTKPDFKINSFSETRARFELIIDEGQASEEIKVLGYGITSDFSTSDKQRIENNFATVPTGSTTAELRLMVKAYEDGNQADDVDCSISINKIPVQTL